MNLVKILGNLVLLSFLAIEIKSQKSLDVLTDESNSTILSNGHVVRPTTTKSAISSETTVTAIINQSREVTSMTSFEARENLTDDNITQTGTTNMPQNQTEVMSTTQHNVTMEITTNKPENCMKTRKDDFVRCMEALGDNALAFITANNMTGFLDDMCDANGSKPYMECLQRHFRDCPAFLTRPEVEVLQFGPYHIKDVTYFSSIDQMCSCVTGLVCIQELIKIKRITEFFVENGTSSWRMPKLKLLCDDTISRNIGCVRKNLRQCQSPLTRRYGDDFTNEDAEDIKRIYSFNKEHCTTVKSDDFQDKYRCIEEESNSVEFRECVTGSNVLQGKRRLCQMRSCVEESIEDNCEEDSDELIPLYIDAVNVYRQESYRILNNICSSAVNSSISIATVIVSVLFVLIY